MKTYIFFRGGFFYAVDLENDQDAIENAKCNKGTTKVENLQGAIIWQQFLN